MSAEPTSYSFWRYDQYPYFLGSPAADRQFKPGTGWIVTPTKYGGHRFTEFANLPLKSGHELHKKLEALEADRKRQITLINIEMDQKLDALLKEYGLSRKDKS